MRLNSSIPSFSVTLCVNRNNPWLLEAIESILKQDDPDFEFLISENGRCDELWSILQTVAASDKRIRLFRSSIEQLSFNLNFLADNAKGDYLVRMDADDISLPHRFRTLRHTLVNNPVDILGSAALLIDENGKPIKELLYPENDHDIKKKMVRKNPFCHPSVAMRRQFLIDVKGYLGGYHSEDCDLWLRAKRINASMHNLQEVLFHYRRHERGQSSRSFNISLAETLSYRLRELIIQPNLGNIFSFGYVAFRFIPFLCLPEKLREKLFAVLRSLKKNKTN